MVKLLNVTISPYGRKVKMALLEKDIPFEAREPDLEAAASGGDAELEEVSPQIMIPCIIDGDVRLFDSTVILEYLEDRWPEPALLPVDPAERARVRMIEEVCDTTYEAVVWGIYETTMMAGRVPDDLKSTLLGRARQQVAGLNSWLTRQLNGRPWLNGERFGWGDLAAFPCVSSADALGFSPEDERLAVWLRTVRQRPSAQQLSEELAEWFKTPLNRPTDIHGSWKRLYRDHRLEWIIRSGGLQVVVDGVKNNNIRFSREIA